MSNYIYNETLSGTIDWVNATFTTAQNIDRVEEIYLGWVAYRDITFASWTNSITFAVAPPIWAESPTIDYFVFTTAPVVSASSVTFGDIIDDTFDKIGATRTSGVYLETQIKRQINKGFKRIKNIRAFKDKVLQYTFNKANDSYAIGYNSSSVTISHQDYIPSAGAIIIGDTSFVPYSTYTAWVFWASAWYTYATGDKVSVGYKIPTGVKRPSEVIMDRQVLTYVDNREFITGANGAYTIFQDTNWDQFIFLPYKSTEAVITVKYVPELDTFTDDADIINIMYDYSDVLSLYAAYNVLLLREDDRWQAIKQEYKELLKDYQTYKSKAVDGINNKFRTTPLVSGNTIFTRSSFK